MSTSAPRVVFSAAFEGLFSKDVRSRIAPEFKPQLLKLGINLDKPFNPAYPVEVWANAVAATSRHLYPTATAEEAQRLIGRDTIAGFGETMVGKAMFAMLRLIGITRTLERSARSYAASSNYTQVTLTKTGPTSYDFQLNEMHTLPQFDMGIVEGMLTYLGAKQLNVTLKSKNVDGFTLHLEWSS